MIQIVGFVGYFSHDLTPVSVTSLHLKEIRQGVIKQDTTHSCALTTFMWHTYTDIYTYTNNIHSMQYITCTQTYTTYTQTHIHTHRNIWLCFMYVQYFSIDYSCFSNYKLQDNQSGNIMKWTYLWAINLQLLRSLLLSFGGYQNQ